MIYLVPVLYGDFEFPPVTEFEIHVLAYINEIHPTGGLVLKVLDKAIRFSVAQIGLEISHRAL